MPLHRLCNRAKACGSRSMAPFTIFRDEYSCWDLAGGHKATMSLPVRHSKLLGPVNCNRALGNVTTLAGYYTPNNLFRCVVKSVVDSSSYHT